jgi:hypothetical protein
VDDSIWDDITDPHIGYYDRQGNRISLRQWGELRYGKTWREGVQAPEDGDDYARIGLTTVGPVRVSTVWLGLDHRMPWPGGGPPVIFETMVFGGADDQAQERYCTEAAALAGHDQWVARQRSWRMRWRALVWRVGQRTVNKRR